MFKYLFSNLNVYIYLFLASIVIFFVIKNISSKNSIDALNIQLSVCENKIENLKNESELFKSRISLAENKAKHEISKGVESASKILNSSVSKNCEEAISWGISQAYKI